MESKKTVRRILLLQGLAILAFGAQAAQASNVGVDVNINLGGQPRQVYVPQPAYVAPPAPVMVVEEDAQFIYPEELGFYVAVGVPYDLFYLNNSYYIIRDGRWLRAQSSRGPWMAQRYRELPPALRRYRVERIREFRNREYVVYKRDRDHYRGRELRSDKGHWKEQKREMKAQNHELRRDEKDLRKDERRFDKEQRKDDKEQRKDEKRAEKEERRER